MIMPEKLSLSDFVTRRLHPVKVTIQLMAHELERNTEAGSTKINAELLGSAINTIELFVEDYERLLDKSQTTSKTSPAVERKFVGEDTPSAS
jgi:hypothetical protein